ncbi:hypothetical protein E4U33_001255, partial [Claviceps sp. LM78 group G4]
FRNPVHEDKRALTECKQSVVEIRKGPGTLSLPGIKDYTNMHSGRGFDMPDAYTEPWREQYLNVSEGRRARLVGYLITASAHPRHQVCVAKLNVHQLFLSQKLAHG